MGLCKYTSMNVWIKPEEREELLKKRRIEVIQKLDKDGLTVTDIAFIMNVNKSSISRMLRFGRNVSVKT